MSEEKLTMDNIHSNGRWTTGGQGSHWDGCEDVHWDCKIIALTARIAELEAENRWIPVSERLPEHPNWVIVNDEAGNVFPAVYKKDEGWTDDLLDTYNEEYPKIISWRPLPQPPEEQE